MRKKGWSLDGTRSENVVTRVKRYISGRTFFLDQKIVLILNAAILVENLAIIQSNHKIKYQVREYSWLLCPISYCSY